ncbi:hypothetical protein HYX70_02430 [Candidatus Saccharibacteria bacterium]|nr:hypothetical protein [Candidatus Saccharibacteria bacterium]
MSRFKQILISGIAVLATTSLVWLSQSASAHAATYTTANLNQVPWSISFPNLFTKFNGRCSDNNDPANPRYYGVGQWSWLSTRNDNNFSQTSLTATAGQTVDLYIVYGNIYCESGTGVIGTWNYISSSSVDNNATLNGVPTNPIFTNYTDSYDGSTFAITAVPITITIPKDAPVGNNTYTVSYNAQRINLFDNGTPNTCVGSGDPPPKPNPPNDPNSASSYGDCQLAISNLSINVNVTATPRGNLSASCTPPGVTGKATDPAQPNKPINVDLYYDSRDDSKLVNTVAYNRVTTDSNGNFSTGIPDIYLDGRDHKVYAYAIGKNQNAELSGSPASFKCPVAPQFRPWLQTKNGDVTATGSITGQDFFRPGSRNNYDYAEATIYTANGAAGTQTFTAAGSSAVVPRDGSLNPPGSKFSRVLTENGSQAVVEDYTGVLSGVSAYVGGENYFDPQRKNDNPAPHYKLSVVNKITGKQVASTEGYAANFQYINARVTENMADASKAISGSYKITITFDNDAYGDLANNPTADRNLLVDQIKVYGNSVSGPEASYVRASQKVNGNNPSANFCSLNFYYLSALVDNGDFSCRAAGTLGYVFGDNLNNSFSQITNAASQAWSNAQSNPKLFCATTSLPLNCDPSKSEIVQLTGDSVINGLTIPPGRHTIWVKGGSLRIAGNIVPAVANNRLPQEQPVLGIIVDSGDVNVAPGVTQVNAMVYAAGKFNTCTGYPSVACAKQLTVNGQIITANGYTFGRNYFDRYSSNQNPAELFVLNPLGVSFAPPGFDKNSWNLDSQLNYGSLELQPRLR